MSSTQQNMEHTNEQMCVSVKKINSFVKSNQQICDVERDVSLQTLHEVTQRKKKVISWFVTVINGCDKTLVGAGAYPSTAPMTVPATRPLRPRFSLKRPPVTAGTHRHTRLISILHNELLDCVETIHLIHLVTEIND